MRLVLHQQDSLQQQQQEQQQPQPQNGNVTDLPTYHEVVNENSYDAAAAATAATAAETNKDISSGSIEQQQPLISTHLNAPSCQITVVSPSQDRGE